MPELGDDSKRNATVVVDNLAAMNAALAAADALNAETVLDMHRALMQHADPKGAGSWRDEPVWIGTSSASPVGAEYVAPDCSRVPELMDDLMVYARRNDIQILAQAAIAHAQFESVPGRREGNRLRPLRISPCRNGFLQAERAAVAKGRCPGDGILKGLRRGPPLACELADCLTPRSRGHGRVGALGRRPRFRNAGAQDAASGPAEPLIAGLETGHRDGIRDPLSGMSRRE